MLLFLSASNLFTNGNKNSLLVCPNLSLWKSDIHMGAIHVS